MHYNKINTENKRTGEFIIFGYYPWSKLSGQGSGHWSGRYMFKFVVIIRYYKIEFLPQLFVGTGTGGM